MTVRAAFIDIDEDLPFKGHRATGLLGLAFQAIEAAALASDPLDPADVAYVQAAGTLPARFVFGSPLDVPDVFINGQPISEAIGTYLPLSGGTMQGDITMADGKTIDGVDLGAFASATTTALGQKSDKGHGHTTGEIANLDAALAALLPKSGGTMAGKLNAMAAAAASAGLNLGQGATPSNANLANGDLWITSAGLFARYNNLTKQLAESGHKHDGTYLSLLGGDLQGALRVVGLTNSAQAPYVEPVGAGTVKYRYYLVRRDANGNRTLPTPASAQITNGAIGLNGNDYYNRVFTPNDLPAGDYDLVVYYDWAGQQTGYFLVGTYFGIGASNQIDDFGNADGKYDTPYVMPTYNETATVRAARFIADSPQNTNTILGVNPVLSVTGNTGDTKTLDTNMSFGMCLRVNYTAGADIHIKVYADAAKTKLLYEAGSPTFHQAAESDAEPWGIFDVDASGDLTVEITNGTNVQVDFVIVKMG